MSEGILANMTVLACVLLDLRCAAAAAAAEKRRSRSGLPDAPGLEPPGVRMLRMAWAPKLIRRTKGVVGAVRDMASSSSTAFSSMESELLVEMLPRR